MIDWQPFIDLEHAYEIAKEEDSHDAAKIAACTHRWHVELCHDGNVFLFCDGCPAGVDSLLPDGQEAIWGDVGDPLVRIEAGRHSWRSWPFTVPVAVQVEVDWAGGETPEIREINVIITQRGPANFGP
jgi:hypothetical protein